MQKRICEKKEKKEKNGKPLEALALDSFMMLLWRWRLGNQMKAFTLMFSKGRNPVLNITYARNLSEFLLPHKRCYYYS
jgi:hypothetical protein